MTTILQQNKQFNPKNFSIQDLIIKRVNLEAEVEHASDPVMALPKYEKLPKPKKNIVGWYVFVKGILRELNP